MSYSRIYFCLLTIFSQLSISSYGFKTSYSNMNVFRNDYRERFNIKTMLCMSEDKSYFLSTFTRSAIGAVISYSLFNSFATPAYAYAPADLIGIRLNSQGTDVEKAKIANIEVLSSSKGIVKGGVILNVDGTGSKLLSSEEATYISIKTNIVRLELIRRFLQSLPN